MGRTRLRGLEIAGIQIGIEVPDTCEWEWPETAVRDFACPPREPEVHVGLRIAEVGAGQLQGELYRIGGSTFEIARRGDDWLIALSRGGRRRQLALFDRDFRIGEIVQSPEWAQERRYPLAGGLDEWLVLQRTVARGGLCVSGRATLQDGGARIELGNDDSGATQGWRVASPSLIGRQTLVLRSEGVGLRVFRTPWSTVMDDRLGKDARVVELYCFDASERIFRELLDPNEAAEELVGHAVLPLNDERFLDRVLRNARRASDQTSFVRVGVPAAQGRSPIEAPAPLAPVLMPLRGLG
ncbi:MAG: hypothetical protein R3F21_00625 [Myxococcota bacterium]